MKKKKLDSNLVWRLPHHASRWIRPCLYYIFNSQMVKILLFFWEGMVEKFI